MNLTISFKHLEHTPSLDQKIRSKSEKLEKYFDGKFSVKWTCYVKEKKHYAEIDVSGPRVAYHATADSDNLYKSLDKVIHKIERQLSKKKQIGKNHIHRKPEDLEILDPEDAWADYDENKFDDVAY